MEDALFARGPRASVAPMVIASDYFSTDQCQTSFQRLDFIGPLYAILHYEHTKEIKLTEHIDQFFLACQF